MAVIADANLRVDEGKSPVFKQLHLTEIALRELLAPEQRKQSGRRQIGAEGNRYVATAFGQHDQAYACLLYTSRCV